MAGRDEMIVTPTSLAFVSVPSYPYRRSLHLRYRPGLLAIRHRERHLVRGQRVCQAGRGPRVVHDAVSERRGARLTAGGDERDRGDGDARLVGRDRPKAGGGSDGARRARVAEGRGDGTGELLRRAKL